MRFKILKAIFIAVLVVEFYQAYIWVIQPLIPIFQSLLNGVSLKVGAVNVAHPIGMLSINGMNAMSLANIITDTTVRIAICSLIVSLTFKAYGLLRRVVAM